MSEATPISRTKTGFFDIGRRLVSKKKNRFQIDGFDLDLTYITNQLIAMGYVVNKNNKLIPTNTWSIVVVVVFKT